MIVKSESAPALEIKHIAEPQLEFGFGQKLEYPRDGLYLYGPVSSDESISHVRYGVIGTAEGTRRFHNWSQMVSEFIGHESFEPLSCDRPPRVLPVFRYARKHRLGERKLAD